MSESLNSTDSNLAAPLLFERLTGTLGAEVSGIDLNAELDDETVETLSAHLVEHKVLFFRNQPITTARHLAVALRFGRSEPYALGELGSLQFHPDYRDVAVLDSTPSHMARADVWHSDVSFQSAPSFGSMLRCVLPAVVGGDTLWADMEAAYEGLDDATRQHLSGLTGIHDWRGQIPNALERGIAPSIIEALEARLPPSEHPVVRTHPVSGRKSIYVNSAFTTHIKGMSRLESDALLQKLFRLATVPDYQCRFRWRKDSIAFWDNRSTQHYAVADYAGQRRRMERVTFRGDVPF